MRIATTSKCLTMTTVIVVLCCGFFDGGRPSNPNDICSVFQEKRGWFKWAIRAEERWNIKLAILMAVIYKESSFDRNARPPRKRLLVIFPGRRPSTALGYAQALRGTWSDYQKASNRKNSSRKNFGDSIDFVGWYLDRAARDLMISRSDAKNLYVAYHDGIAGYRSKRWTMNKWLNSAASKVERQAALYQVQLDHCKRGPARKYASRH